MADVKTALAVACLLASCGPVGDATPLRAVTAPHPLHRAAPIVLRPREPNRPVIAPDFERIERQLRKLRDTLAKEP